MDTYCLKKPRKWDVSSIGRFMLWIGPTSSVLDITKYLLMYFIIGALIQSLLFPLLHNVHEVE